MSDLSFSEEAWRDYLYWQTQDRKTIRKINQLIQSIQRDGPENGLGKPELLRYQPAYSRRIDEKNRLVYKINNDVVYVVSCKGHYE